MSIQNYVCGFDEVGRGAIAGPVVVASVVFYNYSNIPYGIRDSKKISASKRLILYKEIKRVANVGLGIVMPNIIDCVKNRCTLGEISDVLRSVFGEY